jgi:TetR/AcrR family transcriptional regulator
MSRESNKQDKLERITLAAQKLFGAKGISDVTTNEIAVAAGVAAGTLFLYAKTKGELLLLAQNADYEQAHEAGLKAQATKSNSVDAIMALITPIIQCNRKHVENGRTYLQEVVFGSSNDVHRQKAVELMGNTETSVAAILSKYRPGTPAEAQVLAKVIMSIVFLTLSSPLNTDHSVEQILLELETQIRVLGI